MIPVCGEFSGLVLTLANGVTSEMPSLGYRKDVTLLRVRRVVTGGGLRLDGPGCWIWINVLAIGNDANPFFRYI